METYCIGLRDDKSGVLVFEVEYDTQEEAEEMFEEFRCAMETIDNICNGASTLCGYLSVMDENGEGDTIDWC